MEFKKDLEGVKKKIKKLLALSKSPVEAEAAAALRKAHQLMREYHLGESECRYAHNAVKATKRPSEWRAILAMAVAPLYYCETYRSERSGLIMFYGDEFDAYMAGEMYRYLVKTIDRMTKQNVRKNAKLKYRNDYRLGIACRLFCRMKEMGQSASWVGERDAKLLAVKKALESEVALTTDKIKRSKTGNGFNRGVQAADDISLQRQTTGNGGRYLEARV
jgi:hypothetical protein